jgi:hypothetical protein
VHRPALPLAASLALALALLPSPARAGEAGLVPFLDLETGVAFATRNDVRVPGNGGTQFSLAGGDFQSDRAPFVRVRAGASYGRHHLLLTFAPLRLSGRGLEGGSVLFRGLTFTTGDSSYRYRFDTYRLTYRYALVAGPRLDLQLGASALLRDAEIRLSQPGQSTAEKNVGVVPLLSFRLAWRLGGGPFGLVLDGDALAAPQGRAEDVSLALEYTTGELAFRAGYRILEGGADNDRVYSFALVNHVLFGARYAF